MLLPMLIFFLVSCYSQSVSGAPATYDQRQTGDVNVQIHLKDVQVVALLDSELFDDYEDINYDYADFTIKPLVKPTTSSGSSTTSSPWYTWPTNPPKSTEKPEDASSTQSSDDKSTTASSTSSTAAEDSSSTSPVSDLTSTEASVVSSTELAGDLLAIERVQTRNKAAPINLCQSGYFKDSKGRCKKGLRKRFSLIPFVMRMLPQRPLVQPETNAQQ